MSKKDDKIAALKESVAALEEEVCHLQVENQRLTYQLIQQYTVTPSVPAWQAPPPQEAWKIWC